MSPSATTRWISRSTSENAPSSTSPSFSTPSGPTTSKGRVVSWRLQVLATFASSQARSWVAQALT